MALFVRSDDLILMGHLASCGAEILVRSSKATFGVVRFGVPWGILHGGLESSIGQSLSWARGCKNAFVPGRRCSRLSSTGLQPGKYYWCLDATTALIMSSGQTARNGRIIFHAALFFLFTGVLGSTPPAFLSSRASLSIATSIATSSSPTSPPAYPPPPPWPWNRQILPSPSLVFPPTPFRASSPRRPLSMDLDRAHVHTQLYTRDSSVQRLFLARQNVGNSRPCRNSSVCRGGADSSALFPG
jgi:hypothetical protein